MANKKIKKGSPVLFYGERLTVVGMFEKTRSDGKVFQLVHIHDEDKTRRRDEMKVKLNLLRQRLVDEADDLSANQQRAILADISVISDAASEVTFSLNLRVDLLEWWEEQGAWVSNGRIMSDDQRKRWGDLPPEQRPGLQAKGHFPWARFVEDEGLGDAVQERTALLQLEAAEGA